jgi:ABC-type polysaccharide/polyol phosphate export permease
MKTVFKASPTPLPALTPHPHSAGRGLNSTVTRGLETTAPSLRARVWRGLDMAIAFVLLERTLIIRHVKLSGRGSVAASFSTAVKTILILNVHIWGWYALDRQLPGSTSYIVYNAGGFLQWFFFGSIVRSMRPYNSNFDRNLNVKWIQIIIAHIVWESVMVLLGVVIVIWFYMIVQIRCLGEPIGHYNILLLLLTSMITATLAFGCGLVMRTAEERWPIAGVIWESLRWVIFVTSGLYTPYSSMPWYVAEYAWFSPLLSLLEFSRKGFDDGYPVQDLSLLYAGVVSLIVLFLGLEYRRRQGGGGDK